MVLQYQYGKKSAEYLQSLGLSVDFKTYAGMQHSACAEEFDYLSDYLKTVLALAASVTYYSIVHN